ncbi:conserved hypothetical protein [Burkholderia diffusa]|nr:conserved hypothetical protein [Burkholderia diffusa]
MLPGHTPNPRLRGALIANLLTHTHETAVSVAQRCGVHRQTVAEHTAVLESALLGSRQRAGAFDAAFGRIDTLLRAAGIVVEASTTQPEHETASAA